MEATKCVTGATGYISVHLIERLLAKSHRVRGTARTPESSVAEALQGLPHAVDQLELVHADLLEPHSFDEAVQGCDTVFHVASPYVLTVADPANDLLAPAVEGTINVLGACLTSPAVKRVVLTSSVAAIVGSPDGRLLTEDDWNTDSALDNNPYSYSKTQAERAAWDFMEEHQPDFDLVVINPSAVLGPSHRESVGPSVGLIRDLMTGKIPAVVDIDVSFVDVRDVADAHILAAETPEADGRYICVAGVATIRELVEAIKNAGYTSYRLPRFSLESPVGTRIARIAFMTQPPGVRQYLRSAIGKRLRLDSSKIENDLHIEFRTLDDTLRDTIEDLIAKQVIPQPR